MGWFWASSTVASQPAAAHPLTRTDACPPAGCPMHTRKSSPSSSVSPQTPQKSPLPLSKACCPVKESNAQPPSLSTPSTFSKLNPLNYMPSNLSQHRAQNQTVELPLERTLSSIPRGDAESNWEYPSPQQMYNAMLRKGYTDTPQDAVEPMVAVHNFLNEGAWAEIVEWERRFGKGLSRGWQECTKGEEAARRDIIKTDEERTRPRLMRFMGRPNDMTPKANILQWMGWLYPARFGGEPPFDRHDWYVQRQVNESKPREVRYVIDYYSGPPEPTGEPVFYLDVRPAIDRPSAAVERIMRWGGDIWYRASGATMREKKLS